MSDFLGRLAARALGSTPAVRPRPRALFEPDAIGGGEPLEVEEQRDGPSTPGTRPPATPEAPVTTTREPVPAPPPAAEAVAPRDGRQAPAAEPTAHAPPSEDPPVPHPRPANPEAPPVVVEQTREVVAPPREDPPVPHPRPAGPEAPLVVVEQTREVVAPGPPPPPPRREGPRAARELATRAGPRAPEEPSEAPAPPAPQTASPPLRNQAIARARSLAPPPTPAPRRGDPWLPDAPPGPAPAPIVEVTIGRLEVRATVPAEPARLARAPERAEPLSLDRYVRERARGTRP